MHSPIHSYSFEHTHIHMVSSNYDHIFVGTCVVDGDQDFILSKYGRLIRKHC